MKLIEKLQSFFTKTLDFAKRKPVWFGLGVLLTVIVLVSLFGGGNKLDGYDIESVIRRDIVSLVDVTGKVSSPGKVDLGLERGGKIAAIEVNVGDKVLAGKTLIITSNMDLWARYNEAKANLAIEQLNLEEVRGTSAIDQDSAFADLKNTLEDSYISAENIVYNKISGMFRGAEGSSISFGITSDSGRIVYLDVPLGERLDIRYMKKALEEDIYEQSSLVDSVTKDNILEFTATTEKILSDIQDLLNVLVDAFDGYQTDDADDQDAVDTERANLFTARSLTSDTVIALRDAKQDYLGEIATLVSPTSNESLRATLLQEEAVKIAQARVDAAWADIAKSIIKAPFSGTITRVDTEVGEIVSSNSPIVSMISDAPFEIEAYIAEADISRATVGSAAKVTLDAYSSGENFEAALVFVDPAETVIDGVSTYKALLHFKELDTRILTGMTADIEIITGESKGVLAVPIRAVFDKDGKSIVRVLVGNKTVEKEVSTGLKSFDGYIEIISGLEEGEQVVVFSRD